ncbi:unannotated protein [freshwater metagenome]|uniref:Unannotated protein n=1 Tax=freshwater metagenome TaxID=449393 RepID=A0A6J7I308_9ZZZZ
MAGEDQRDEHAGHFVRTKAKRAVGVAHRQHHIKQIHIVFVWGGRG